MPGDRGPGIETTDCMTNPANKKNIPRPVTLTAHVNYRVHHTVVAQAQRRARAIQSESWSQSGAGRSLHLPAMESAPTPDATLDVGI